MECPLCHSKDVKSLGKRYALYPTGPVAFFGVAFAMLHQVSAPFDYRCNGCGGNFAHRTKFARVVRVVFLFLVWFLAIAFGLGLLSVFFRH